MAVKLLVDQVEIEKKFLLMEGGTVYPLSFAKQSPGKIPDFKLVEYLVDRAMLEGTQITQGYLPDNSLRVLRDLGIPVTFFPNTMRIRSMVNKGKNPKYILTLKQTLEKDAHYKKCREVEYKIPVAIYRDLILRCHPYIVDKFRIQEDIMGFIYDLDYFPRLKILIAELEHHSPKVLTAAECYPGSLNVTNTGKYSSKQLALQNPQQNEGNYLGAAPLG